MQTYHRSTDPFDRRSGNGSADRSANWVDSNSIFDNQWGSPAATTFPTSYDGKGQKLPEHKQEKFERLYEIHAGKNEQTRKTDILQSYMRNDAKMFMSVLEMPVQQRERVLTLLDKLDTSSKKYGGEPYEKVLLALCSLVSDEALSNEPDPSIDERLLFADDFRELMDCTKTSSSDLRTIRKQIRDQLDEFSE